MKINTYNLPKYETKLKTHAAKIKSISASEDPNNILITFYDKELPILSISAAWVSTHKPQVNGYFVQVVDETGWPNREYFSNEDNFESIHQLVKD